MKYAPLLGLLALVLVAANADLSIDMVYYDPVNARGSEAVLIANNGPDAMDLTGYKLATRTSPQDHTLNGFIQPHSTYLAAYAGWSELKDNSSWPDADHEQPITLANGGGYVQLTTPDGTVLDTVGWKDTEIYLGTPHPGVAKGMALVRVDDTGDNSNDFTEQTPFSSMYTQEAHDNHTTVQITVENVPPHIISIAVEDDLPETEGIQLLPLPNGREIWVNVTVQDNNTLIFTNVTVNGVLLAATNTIATTDTFTGRVTITTNTHELNITVRDENHTRTQSVPLNLLGAASLSIPKEILGAIRPGETDEQTLTLENTGSMPLNLHIRGNPPRSIDHLLGKVTYEIHGEAYELLPDAREHTLNLQPGQQLAVTIRTESSFVPAGTYTGQLVIAGVTP